MSSRGQDRITVETFLVERWLPAIAPTVRPSTRVSYEGHVTLHIVPALGHIRLDRLRPHDLNRLYAERAAAGLSPATIRRIHATLHRALRDAVRWGDATENPAAGGDPPRTTPGHDLATWAPAEVAAFLEAVEGDELEALWVVLVMTGMRRGEALGLKWHDVDLGRSLPFRAALTIRRACDTKKPPGYEPTRWINDVERGLVFHDGFLVRLLLVGSDERTHAFFIPSF